MPYIIQLSDAPIAKDNLLTEYEVQDSVLYGHVVGCVYTDAEIEDAHADFLKGLEGDDHRCAPYFSVENADDGVPFSVTFAEAYRDAYFKKQYNRFKELLDHLTQESYFKAFVGHEIKYRLDEISKLVEDEYGDYVYMDEEYTTLDAFLRYAQSDVPYYLGALFYYKI